MKRIAEELERRGFTVWLDEQQMIGSVVDRMAQGIDSCELCVVFVTANYMRKVNQDDARDPCKFEFMHAFRRLGPAKFIPVVMEVAMLAQRDWVGTLGAAIGGHLYANLSSDDPAEFARGVDELERQAMSLLQPPLPSSSASSIASTASSNSSTAINGNLFQSMVWVMLSLLAVAVAVAVAMGGRQVDQ